MMKPPNIKPVYPIRHEKKKKEQIYIPSGQKDNRFTGRKGPVIFWNIESTDPRSPMYQFSLNNDVDYILRTFRELTFLYKKDFDLYILAHPSQVKAL